MDSTGDPTGDTKEEFADGAPADGALGDRAARRVNAIVPRAAAAASASVTRPDGSRKAAVIAAVLRMPQGQAHPHALGQLLKFRPGTRRRFGGRELAGFDRDKILVVAAL
jgi:hypothetical protein